MFGSSKSHTQLAELLPAVQSIILVICGLFLTTSLNASSFETGIEAYQNKNYEKAIEAFTAANSKMETAASHHNLALAYFQQERPAESLWNLERALTIKPFNASYEFKVDALRQQLALPSKRLTWYQKASKILSTSGWLLIGTIAFWVIIGSLILPKFLQLQSTLSIKVCRTLAVFICLLSAPAFLLNSSHRKAGIVISPEVVNLTAAPASAAPQVGTARPGERAKVIDAYNDFYEVETEAQIIGWISKKSFRKLF